MTFQHEQICLLEEKCKKVTNMIKEQKAKGATQRSSNHQASMHVTDDAKAKLEEELKTLEANKQQSEKKFKHQANKLDEQLK